MCASIVFKAESKPKQEEKNVLGLSSKIKNPLFWGSKMVLFKASNTKFVFLCLFFNVKGSCMPIFIKNINIWAPWNFLKIKTLTCVLWCTPKIWIWTSKIIPDFWIVDLF